MDTALVSSCMGDLRCVYESRDEVLRASSMTKWAAKDVKAGNDTHAK